MACTAFPEVGRVPNAHARVETVTAAVDNPIIDWGWSLQTSQSRRSLTPAQAGWAHAARWASDDGGKGVLRGIELHFVLQVNIGDGKPFVSDGFLHLLRTLTGQDVSTSVSTSGTQVDALTLDPLYHEASLDGLHSKERHHPR